jgi:protein-disulfide isomerase
VRGPLWLFPASLLLAPCFGGCSQKDPPAASFCAVSVGDSPTRGPADAPVTAVEFGDFQCPYCGSVVPTLKEVDAARPGAVRWVFKHLPLPFHSRAMPAAIAAECAHEQGFFWEMYDTLYSHQGALGDADLAAYAAAIGLDVPTWQTCLGSDPPRGRIAADGQAADQARVGATPTFFFDGEPLVGAAPLEDFLAVVDKTRAEAQASGLGGADYYASLERKGCR